MKRLPILLLLILLAGCSALPFGGKTAATANPAAQFDPGQMPVEQKLAFGILELEGTPNAVTAEEARALLPLWQALKALSANQNTTETEISALYGQMKDALAPAQVTAIEQLSWKPEDMQTLAQKYGVQFAQGGPNGGARGTPNPQRETQIAQFRTQRQQSGGGQGGGFDGAGGPPPGAFGGGNTTRAQGTPNPQSGTRRALGGMNRLFADAVIKLLEERAKG